MFNNIEELINYLKYNKNNNITIFYDIETYVYNIKNATKLKKPTLYKSSVYSVACSIIDNTDDDKIKCFSFNNFYEFFETILNAFKNPKTYKYVYNKTITLNAHNSNKFDNHFMLKDLMYYYPDFKRENMYIEQAIENNNTYKLKDFKKKTDKKNIILEKRVKSSINLDMTFFLNTVKFKTQDNLLKTNCSLSTIAKKLNYQGFINKDDMKTYFNYSEFNCDEDLEEKTSYIYAREVYSKLTDKHFKYIKNDVYILAKCFKYYDKIFKDFDYSKMTFSVNILENFNTNMITDFQLLNKVGKEQIKYTDFHFTNKNYYDYLKLFYRGGLNIYNDNYLNTHIENDIVALDINSSYPYVMYKNKIPTFLIDYKDFENYTYIDLVGNLDIYKDEYFSIYTIPIDFMNYILLNIKSSMIKKMIVKYYNIDKNLVYINSNTIKLINLFIDIPLTKIKVKSYNTFKCYEFGNKELIAENYFIKEQGKCKNKLIMENPFNFIETDVKNEHILSQAEIDLSKVLNNGLYGIPALRSHFNLFRLNPQNILENVENGFINSPRNLLFSTFVTSQAFYNLVSPLTNFSSAEIDEFVYYLDTDSIYFSKHLIEKIPEKLIHARNLGAWSFDSDNITDFFIINHKKYAYYDKNKKSIIVKSGGIDKNSFNLKQSFEEFISNDFADGKEIKSKKSIYTKENTIVIYDSLTKIEKGTVYPLYFSSMTNKIKNEIIKKVKEELKNDSEIDDLMYIETSVGTLSQKDIYPINHSILGKKEISVLKMYHDTIEKILF